MPTPPPHRPTSGLLTDFYELTMMCAYRAHGRGAQRACFDLFIRKLPFEGGYAVAAGLDDALAYMEGLSFTAEEIDYLRAQETFDEAFLDWLRTFRFTGDVFAVPEGTLVFPGEPILRVEAPIAEAQLVESALLNIVNFQTLIATKSARLAAEAAPGSVLEFGLRRAQGPDGARSAARAAYIGGAEATSNTEAACQLGIPARGTHAHSWVMSFDDELAAFRAWAERFPESSILLVDTYDTLRSGLPNAITVGRELRARGHTLGGIRLDSGDLAYLSIEARRLLDAAGFHDAIIFASGDLDEWIVHDLKAQGARIDAWGVGTRLVTGDTDPALSGVYKLAALRATEGGTWSPRMKLSDNVAKETLPGVKQVWRFHDADGTMVGDLIGLAEAEAAPTPGSGVTGYNPAAEHQFRTLRGARVRSLLEPVLRGGRRTEEAPPLATVRRRVQQELETLHPTSRRLLNPHVYRVSISEALRSMRADLRATVGK